MTFKNAILTALIAAASGFAGAGIWSVSGLDDPRTRDYLLSNPELLPQMAEAYQKQEAQARLAEVADGFDTPFSGAVLGNPEGSVTLVEFTDYNCGFCRSSVPEVDKLIAENPELRVVVREWPIFEGSDAAASMALAAGKQGKFEAFHRALFDLGPTSDATIIEAGKLAGLDMDQARADAASPEVMAELARNQGLARSIGFTGTPSWIANGQVFEGAVGAEALAEALEAGGA